MHGGIILFLKEKEAAKKQQQQAKSTPSSSKPASGVSTPARGAKPSIDLGSKAKDPSMSQLRSDIEGMGLTATNDDGGSSGAKVPNSNISGSSSVAGGSSVRGSIPSTPKVAISHERVVEEYRRKEDSEGRKHLSLVVVGHVDAGKSTLMGRMLHELGGLSDREHSANERASAKLGKGSFAYAWALDSSEEERARGVTIDVAQDSFVTPHRSFTLLDAPGHRDFIPNMISGAAQADAAILVVDAAKGGFEAGFGPQGQTREHAILVRSLGVQQVIVAVNKLDAVGYDQIRYDDIVAAVRPFLLHIGFNEAKLTYVPCGAAVGENLQRRSEEAGLSMWYDGPTLVEALDKLEPPQRQLDAPLRMPVTNVFRAGQTAISSGIGVSGRLIAGVLSVGDRLSVIPGDESGVVKAIDVDGESAPWAVAGSSVTVFLTGIEMNFINIGSVICPPTALVPMVSSFIAQILVFEPTMPMLAGTALELFHHSSNLSVTLSELIATLDLKTGAILKQKPRVLSRGVTAKVRVTLAQPTPLEPFAVSRDMGRVLLRMHGETVAAGIVLETL